MGEREYAVDQMIKESIKSTIDSISLFLLPLLQACNMNKQDFLKTQSCVLRVNIHCDGCRSKVKKILQKIDGVYAIKIDAEQGKVTVTGNVDPNTLIKKLEKKGKHAELWGPSKGGGANNLQFMNNLNTQFKNFQLDGGKMGKDNNSNKGGQKGGGGGKDQQKGGQQQIMQQQQLMQQQMKGGGGGGAKDFKMPPNNKVDQKTVKFNLPQDEFDYEFDDDDFDDDDFNDEFDDVFDDDLDDDIYGGHGHGNHMSSKSIPVMGNGQAMKGGGGDKKGKGGGGGGGGGFDKGKEGGGGAKKKGGGGGGGGGMAGLFKGMLGGGAKSEGKKGSDGKKDGKNGGGNNKGGGGGGHGNFQVLGEGKHGKSGGEGKNGKNGGGNGNHKGGSNNGGGNNNFNNMISSMKNNGNGNGGSKKGGGGGGFHDMDGGVNHAKSGGPNPSMMAQMGNFPMGHNMTAAAGLPATGPHMMNNGGGGGFYQGMPMGPSAGGPYGGGGGANPQQQQYMAMMMNPQRMNGGDGSYGMYPPQAMMYGRPQMGAMYGPPMVPPPTYHDPLTSFFSDENTNSCTIM